MQWITTPRSSVAPVVFALCPDGEEPHVDCLPITEAEVVARGVRGAILRHAANPRDPILSGHRLDGAPLERAHLAVLPLLAMQQGRMMPVISGVVVSVPDVERVQPLALGAALEAWDGAGMRLVLGRLGAFRLERPAAASDQHWDALDRLWAASRSWITITPVALDRNPGNLQHADPARAREARLFAKETVAVACESVGLPRPVRVTLGHDAFVRGVPPASQFMPFPRDPSKTRRVCVHAWVEFAEVVEGPVVLGAGRHFGMGVCRVARSSQPSFVEHGGL